MRSAVQPALIATGSAYLSCACTHSESATRMLPVEAATDWRIVLGCAALVTADHACSLDRNMGLHYQVGGHAACYEQQTLLLLQRIEYSWWCNAVTCTNSSYRQNDRISNDITLPAMQNNSADSRTSGQYAATLI